MKIISELLPTQHKILICNSGLSCSRKEIFNMVPPACVPMHPWTEDTEQDKSTLSENVMILYPRESVRGCTERHGPQGTIGNELSTHLDKPLTNSSQQSTYKWMGLFPDVTEPTILKITRDTHWYAPIRPWYAPVSWLWVDWRWYLHQTDQKNMH